MNFEDWEAIYREILADFQFKESEDIESAKSLVEILHPDQLLENVEQKLTDEISGSDFIILGPCIPKGLIIKELSSFPQESKVLLITVGEATKNCMDIGISPSMVFTDLDGFPVSDLSANQKGALTFIHAHGDNLSSLREWVPRFSQMIVPTCQCKPFKGIFNWGGFTDGDRAYCVLRHFAARRIDLLGFDFKEPCGKKKTDIAVKKKKLAWAKKIIEIVDESRG